MWRNRSFLKGLGIGFIVGAILLQLMITVQETDKRIQESALQPSPAGQKADPAADVKGIKDKAAALGLQVFDKDVKVYNQSEVDELVKKAADAALQQQEAAPSAPPKVTVFIYADMTASNVADYLNRSGVIADRAAFEKELLQNRLASKIRSDLYTFNLNENIHDVIAKITTPQPR